MMISIQELWARLKSRECEEYQDLRVRINASVAGQTIARAAFYAGAEMMREAMNTEPEIQVEPDRRQMTLILGGKHGEA